MLSRPGPRRWPGPGMRQTRKSKRSCASCRAPSGGSMPPNMRSHRRKVVTAVALVSLTSGLPQAQSSAADPPVIARTLAARYPAQPIMSYIPALSWSGQLRLAAITGEAKWRQKALRDIEAFTSGRTPAIAEPYRLTSLAGALAFVDAGDKALAAKVG